MNRRDGLDAQILTTKLSSPPPHAGQVLRPRLHRQLEAGVQQGCPLTVVSAPAGYGKTTLVSEWIRQSGHNAVWVALDEGDNDPTRFWAYVVAALQEADPSIGQSLAVALRSPQPPSTVALTTPLINDLVRRAGREQQPLLLVLDDYHTITTPEIHESLDALLARLPRSHHVIVTSRHTPPLSLSRLRGRGQLVEVTARDLRFTVRETEELLNVVQALDLTKEDVAGLSERTEGWAVGLHMAALSLRRQSPLDRHAFVRAFAGDDRLVADYLIDEALAHQPAGVQRFLRETSILERLCGPLCDAVTGRNDSQQVIRHLETAHLFIVPLDHRRVWYRYHHLFAELLRHRLENEAARSEIQALHGRASRWYAQAGLGESAVAHAIQAGDEERAVQLITDHIAPILLRGELVLAQRWLDSIGEEAVRSHAILCIARAWSTLPHSITRTREWIRQAETHLADSARQEDRALIVAHAAALNVAIARVTEVAPEGILALCRDALAKIPASNPKLQALVAFWMGETALNVSGEAEADEIFSLVTHIERESGGRTMSLVMNGIRAWRRLAEGRLHEAAAICHHALRTLEDAAGHPDAREPMACYPHIVLGQVHLAWNELALATRHLARGIELGELTTTERPLLNAGYCALARVRGLKGNFAQGMVLIHRAEEMSALWLPDAGDIPAHRARLWLLQARCEHNARPLARAIAWADADTFRSGDSFSVASLARIEVRIDQCRVHGAPDVATILPELATQLHLAEAANHLRWQIETLTLQALAFQMQNLHNEAQAVLARALGLARPEGFVRYWLDHGAPMARLLETVTGPQDLHKYAQELLLALAAEGGCPESHPGRGPSADRAPAPDQETLIEPLTPREQEVLSVIATGATNAEIARDLHIALNTVKTHITHIFGKLGATHRTEAVARGRDLGLID